jgi:hypothetical protein
VEDYELAKYQAQRRTVYEHSNKCCSIGGGGIAEVLESQVTEVLHNVSLLRIYLCCQGRNRQVSGHDLPMNFSPSHFVHFVYRTAI